MTESSDEFSLTKPNIKIDATLDATPIVSGVGKHLDESSSIYQKIYYMIFGNLQAKSDREKRLLEAQTDSDVAKIKSGEYRYVKGDIVPSKYIEEAYYQKSIIDGAHRVEQCLQGTCQHLAALGLKISSESPSETFINRWMREASAISESDLQQIWGRMLAEEIACPNSISFRTFNIMQQMSPQDARLFAKACVYIVDNAVLLCYGTELDQDKINTLEEFGLIRLRTNNFTSRCGHEMFHDKKCPVLSYGQFKIYIEDKKNNDTSVGDIEFAGHQLTKAGKDLLRIAFTPTLSSAETMLGAFSCSMINDRCLITVMDRKNNDAQVGACAIKKYSHDQAAPKVNLNLYNNNNNNV